MMFDRDLYYEIGFYDAMNNFNSFYVQDLCCTIQSVGQIVFWDIDGETGEHFEVYSFSFRFLEYISESLKIVIDTYLFEESKKALSDYLM